MSVSELHLSPGDVLYREGDPPDYVCIIESGELVLYHDHTGTRQNLERRGPGSIIGELSVLTGQPRAVSVLATGPCKIHKISADLILNRFDAIEPILRACIETSFRFAARLKTGEEQPQKPIPFAQTSLLEAQSLIDRFRFEHDLQEGLDQGQFYLNYQPIFDVATQQMVGFESLMRWQHPLRGFVPPDRFIPIAADIGSISQLTNLAIMDTCATLRELEYIDPEAVSLCASINVAGEDFQRTDLFDFVAHVLDLHDLQPDRLHFEVTETSLVPDCETTRDTIHKLRNMGCGIAIDDFGTGYSNLAYLKDLPLTAIKIDRAFVGDACKNTASHAIVKMVAGLGKDLGLRVVGEGVETPEDLEILANLGCDLAQGYLLSKPLPKDLLFKMIVPGSKPAQAVA